MQTVKHKLLFSLSLLCLLGHSYSYGSEQQDNVPAGDAAVQAIIESTDRLTTAILNASIQLKDTAAIVAECNITTAAALAASREKAAKQFGVDAAEKLAPVIGVVVGILFLKLFL